MYTGYVIVIVGTGSVPAKQSERYPGVYDNIYASGYRSKHGALRLDGIACLNTEGYFGHGDKFFIARMHVLATKKEPMQVKNNCFLASGVKIAYFIDTDPIDYDVQSSLA